MRVALIGTGAIARDHLAYLHGTPGVQVVALCDRLGSVAEVFADEFQVPAWFHDHGEMIATTKPDIVHITTPVTSHFSLAWDALEAGAHVFVEKPLATSYDAFRQLRELSEKRKRWLLEDQNYLFNDQVQNLRALVQSGSAGRLLRLEIEFCADLTGPGSPFTDPGSLHPSASEPGGIVSDFLPHFAYLCYAFLGTHSRVATWYRKRGSSILLYDEFEALVETQEACCNMYFNAGVGPSVFRIRLIGSNFRAEADLFEPRLSISKLRKGNAGMAALLDSITHAGNWLSAGSRGFRSRLSGMQPSSSGLKNLIYKTYSALSAGAPCPLTLDHLDQCAWLTECLRPCTRQK